MNNLLLKQALEKPNNMAFICDDITVTYKESWERVLDLKSMLDVGGVEAGDKVALITEEPLEFVHMFMAISLCDAIIIPVYLKSGIEKINKLLKYFKIKYVFTQEDAVGDMLDGSYNPISTNEKSNYFLFCNKNLTLDESLKDAKLILFSSGTTSFPKAVMLSKNNIYSNIDSILDYLKLNENDRILIIKNLNHASSIIGEFLVGLYAGVPIYFTRKLPRTRTILQLIDEYKITTFFAIPFILDGFLEYKNIDKFDLSSLHRINFYGGKLGAEKIRDLCNKFPNVEFIYSYGLTEAAPRVTYIDKEGLNTHFGSCGRAIKDVKVEIRDENGEILPTLCEGEITVTGPNVMIGYYMEPQLTSERLRKGVLYTKDIGYLDADGFLYVTGRKDNMFIVAGKNVYPEEVEAVINRDKAVHESLVYYDEQFKNGIVALVTTFVDEELDQKRLLCLCEKELEFYKIPNKIIEVSNFEKTISGKIVRNQY